MYVMNLRNGEVDVEELKRPSTLLLRIESLYEQNPRLRQYDVSCEDVDDVKPFWDDVTYRKPDVIYSNNVEDLVTLSVFAKGFFELEYRPGPHRKKSVPFYVSPEGLFSFRGVAELCSTYNDIFSRGVKVRMRPFPLKGFSANETPVKTRFERLLASEEESLPQRNDSPEDIPEPHGIDLDAIINSVIRK